MFITSQAASCNSATRGHLHHRHHKENPERPKHRGHDRIDKAHALFLDISKTHPHPVAKAPRKIAGSRQDSFSTSQIIMRKKSISQSHLDAIISPRKAMSSSQLLLQRSNSLQFLQLPKVHEKLNVDNLHVSLLKRSTHKIAVAKDRKGPEFTRSILHDIRPMSLTLPVQEESKRVKQPSVQMRLYKNFPDDTKSGSLQKAASLPALSPTSSKEFKSLYGTAIFCVPRPASTHGPYCSKSSDGIPRMPSVSLTPSRDTKIDEKSLEKSFETFKVGDAPSLHLVDTGSYTAQSQTGQRIEPNEVKVPDCNEDRIIPIHSSVIFRKKANKHRHYDQRKQDISVTQQKPKSTAKKSRSSKRSCKDFHAFGNGLKDGIVSQPAVIDIVSKSGSAWGDIEVEFIGPRLVPPKYNLQHIEKDTCRITYLPESVGIHTISIKSKGKHVSQSPYQVIVDFERVSIWKKA